MYMRAHHRKCSTNYDHNKRINVINDEPPPIAFKHTFLQNYSLPCEDETLQVLFGCLAFRFIICLAQHVRSCWNATQGLGSLTPSQLRRGIRGPSHMCWARWEQSQSRFNTYCFTGRGEVFMCLNSNNNYHQLIDQFVTVNADILSVFICQ